MTRLPRLNDCDIRSIFIFKAGGAMNPLLGFCFFILFEAIKKLRLWPNKEGFGTVLRSPSLGIIQTFGPF